MSLDSSDRVWDAFYNLWKPDGHRDPYPHYRVLREQSPVFPVGPKRVLVLGFDACETVLRNTETFAVCGLEWAQRAWHGWENHSSVRSLFNQMNRKDPPHNQPARKLASKFFSHRGLAELQTMVEELAQQHVAQLLDAASRGTADAVTELLPLPTSIMCRLLGLPDSAANQLLSWTDALLLANDFNPPGYGLEHSDAAVEEFRNALLTRSQESPLYRTLREGWDLADSTDITDTLMFVAGAGMHSTSSLLGVGLTMLIEHPEMPKQLAAQSEFTTAFVQECLRYDPPAQFTGRWTTRPAQLAGMQLPAGTMVMLFLGAAGRDPDKFVEPDRFNPTRYLSGEAPRSLSFGFGQHFCVGSKLAELTAEKAFALLAANGPDLAYAGPVERGDGLVLHGFERLPVTRLANRTQYHSTAAAQILGQTLPEALRHIAVQSPQATLKFPRMSAALTVAELQQRAHKVAVALYDEGVRPGTVVGLLTPTGPQIFVGLFGVNLLGAAVSMLPVRSAASQMASVREIDAILRVSGITHVIADSSFETLVRELQSRYPAVRFLEFPIGRNGQLPITEPDPGALSVVQFTSGSTANPKGVTLPHETIVAGLSAIQISAEMTTSDSIVQWVPHYHDMGLFGALSFILAGLDAHVFAPGDFIKDPIGFVRYQAKHRISATTGPDFGYRLMVEALTSSPQHDLDLSSWRLAFNGAEAVRAATVDDFTRVTAAYGAMQTVMYPVYGLAEATLAVSFPHPGTSPTVVHLDVGELANARRASTVAPGTPGSKTVVSVGKPVHGMQVRIINSAGANAAAGQVGEIQIAGPSVTPGYLGTDASPEVTEVFDGTWLRTGDLGFMQDDKMFITGRDKDMIVVHGRNYFPEDAEVAASEVEGVFRKRCAAVASGDELVIVAECSDPAGYEALAANVRRTVGAVMGISAIRCIAVPPGQLPHTTSGKVRRSAVKSQLSLERL